MVFQRTLVIDSSAPTALATSMLACHKQQQRLQVVKVVERVADEIYFIQVEF